MNASFANLIMVTRKHGRNAGAADARSMAARAFTIIELLVVITLIVILVLIAVPSFQSMVYSSEEGMAETHVRNAIRAARDAAVRSNGGADGAAVFMFEPGGRTTIMICVKVGEMTDFADDAGANKTRREIFAQAPGFAPALLPRSWMVRGYVPANAFRSDWYGAAFSNQTTNDGSTATIRNWVFPETGFFNADVRNDGFHRSTFMVRFQAGTGALVGGSTEPALVLAPRNSSQDRSTSLSDELRADRGGRENPVQFVRTWLGQPVNGPNGDRREFIGRRSSDMVLARPVMQLAVYNEQRMAAALRARTDRVTDSVYVDPTNATDNPTHIPMFVGSTVIQADINRWIEGDTNLDDTVSNNTGVDRPEAKLFSIDRMTGVLRSMEVQP